MITTVTITGADDSIKPGQLLQLSREFPFVEWGILVSRTNFGIPRFPSVNWLDDLKTVCLGNPELKLSMHFCGAYVKQLAVGDRSGFEDMQEFLANYQRIQLNFHNIPHTANQHLHSAIASLPDKELIFQHDGVNEGILINAAKAGLNVSCLFDKSGGNGILPKEWPLPLAGIKCGYAGGLGPQNLQSQIEAILEKAGSENIWIDMETHVRSEDDEIFDLEKVRYCLEVSAGRVFGAKTIAL